MRLMAMSAAFLMGSVTFAMSNSTDLAEAIAKQDPRAALYKKLAQASGYVALVSSDPVIEKVQKNVHGFSMVPFEIAGCSAVYIKKPAYFLTSAECFANADGTVNKNRRYGKVYVNFQPYNIDPVSIVIHENFGRTQAQTDFAIFSLEASQADTFASSHTPLEIVTEDFWVTDGQTSLAVGYGKFSEAGDQYGFAKGKFFIQRYPDPADLQAANGKLNVGPQEHLLTYVTAQGDNGVNCKGDAGGPVVTETIGGSGDGPGVVLQGIILGKVGPDGSPAACEAISKYMVVADLRYVSRWIEEAILRSEKSMIEAQAWTKKYAGLRTKLYGNSPVLGDWAEIPATEMAALVKPLVGQKGHEQNKILNRFMQLESARRKSREFLSSASTNKMTATEKWMALSVEDPWIPASENWAHSPTPTHAYNSTVQYANPKPGIPARGPRVRNTSDKTISYTSATLFTGSKSAPKTAKIVLAPGEYHNHFWLNNVVDTVEKITLEGVEGEANALRVDFLLANQEQIAWFNAQAEARRQQEAAAEKQRNDQYLANLRARSNSSYRDSGGGAVKVGGTWYDSHDQAARILARDGWRWDGTEFTRTVRSSSGSSSSSRSSYSTRSSSGSSYRYRSSGSGSSIRIIIDDW